MLVGLDSEVTIRELICKPGSTGKMELTFIYFVDTLGPMDKSFGTDIEKAIVNKVEYIFNETYEK